VIVEPYKLRRWKLKCSSERVQFFTCARPGRSKGACVRVAHQIVEKWLQGLQRIACGTEIAIISLLGRKHGPEGDSEFWFYSFHGAWDLPAERRGRLSFQQWLDRWHKDMGIRVIECPTYDFYPVPPDVLRAVASEVSHFLSEGLTVILIDSGGETRTRQVCKHMAFVEDTRTA